MSNFDYGVIKIVSKNLVRGEVYGMGLAAGGWAWAGSLLKSAIDHFISRRAVMQDRFYQERREAYLGLLSALHKAAVQPSDENSKDFALWQTRCQLFGSSEVSKFAQAIVDTNDRPRAEREAAFKGLITSMRADLRR